MFIDESHIFVQEY